MAHYINADKLIANLKWQKRALELSIQSQGDYGQSCQIIAYETILSIIDSLQQEQPEVDLEKLGEIARHIIAVKQNVEDMRLNEDEWSLLERIGYPHKLNARKEDK